MASCHCHRADRDCKKCYEESAMKSTKCKDEKKQEVWVCASCEKPQTGRQWHSDTGMFGNRGICEKCYWEDVKAECLCNGCP